MKTYLIDFFIISLKINVAPAFLAQIVEIAKPHIGKFANIIILPFPMTSDKKITQKAWDKNARQITDVLKQGLHTAFLTLGDPLTYSTFGYILKSLNIVMPFADIEAIPGITSFHAASARL